MVEIGWFNGKNGSEAHSAWRYLGIVGIVGML